MMKNGNAILFVSFHMKLRVYFKTSRERSTMMKNRNVILVSFEIERIYFTVKILFHEFFSVLYTPLNL